MTSASGRGGAAEPAHVGLSEPRLERAFRGHRGPVTAVAFHQDEQQVVSSSLDGCVFVWHFKLQMRPFRFVGHRGEVYDVAVSSRGNYIASAAADKTVRLWSNTAQGDSHVMKVHSAPVRSVCFSDDATMLLTASDDKSVKMWNVANQRFHGSFTGHTHWVYSAAFCKNADLAASGGEDKVVRVWDVEKRTGIMSFEDFEAPVSKVRFSPDGSCLAACGHDGCVKLWDLRSRRLLQHYDAHTGAASAIDFHPGAGHLASVGEDGIMKLWDIGQGRLLYKVHNQKQLPVCCAFAPSGRSLVTGGRDGLVFAWHCSDHAEGERFGGVPPSPSAAPGAACRADSPGGRCRATGPRRSMSSSQSLISRAQARSSSTPAVRSKVGSNHVAGSAFVGTGGPHGAVQRGVAVPRAGQRGSSPARQRASSPAASRASPIAAAPPVIAPTPTMHAVDPQVAELAMPAAQEAWMASSASCHRPSTAPAAVPETPLATGLPSGALPTASAQVASPIGGADLSAVMAGGVAIPAPLAQTLQSMQSHLELMARTVQLLDRRLAMTEHQVLEMRRELLVGSPMPAPQAGPLGGASLAASLSASYPSVLPGPGSARA